MHIGLVGPIATADIAPLLNGEANPLPKGYPGAPLLATLIGELLQRGHQVSAFTLSSDMPLNKNAAITAHGKNFSITYCPMRPRAWRPNGWLPGRIVDLYRFERTALQHAIAQASPDVVHAHWAYEFALATLATKIPNIITCHDSPYTIARLYSSSRPTKSLYRWLRVLMASKTFREAQCVTAVSPYMRDEIQGLTSTKIHVVPNPIDNQAIALARSRHAPIEARLVMVCNGWDARKNPEQALIAFAELRKMHPSFEFHLYGSDFGPGETGEKWCAARGISDGMMFHGAIPHVQLLETISQFDLLLHPSLEESFGMVIAEAMAMGLPVVAGESSGAVPWVVGKHGTLCNVRNPESITHAILKTLSTEYYNSLSKEGIESAYERFSTERIVSQYYTLYEKALEKKSETLPYPKIETRSSVW